jgi:hypothetical protein
MKTLAFAALLFSLSVPHFGTPASRAPQDAAATAKAARRGQWYMAQSGHAVFCSGPVVTVAGPDGNLQRMATFCQGDKTVVPLRD